ncbi:thioesterase [Pseudonocardia sulfidoxydans NBRC 16205]|uniref:Thioesterase n=1 Tax=Pseudonocardia sulfidoxydans NBRC 16205 TaxID=1223511 RepID=A0A511D9J6_9PSEU|nr:alpha/beta hydrolase [Pseudonocardia sulfidoxydans]GEL21472.1 thioesterase [Pseudonocardia sulfidoxydans NBRC 16205]
MGAQLIAPDPDAVRGVVAGYRSSLDEALRTVRDMTSDTRPRLLVGGVSLGAHVAAAWAAQPGRSPHLAGLLLALPAWTGTPGDAPAALTARATARQVRTAGLDATLAALRASAPRWLADDLTRSWTAHGDGLAAALDEAARTPAPADDVLRRLTVPAGVASCVDDPVHPTAVAQDWTRLLPRARIVETRLRAVSADPATLGRAAVLGWLRASAPQPPTG